MSVEFSQVPLSNLSVGVVLSAPIFDPDQPGTKLLGDGIEINALFLKQLEERGIFRVVVSKRDLAAIHAGTPQGVLRRVSDHKYPTTSKATKQSCEMDRDIDSEDFNPQVDVLGTPKVERLDGHRSDHYDPQHKSLEVMRRERQVAYVDDLFAKLIEGAAAETEALSDVCRESIRAIVADKDLFLCLGLNPYDANYPARHSLHVATVAIAIGVVLGLDDEGLTDLGTGCLIHDVGMMKLDKRLYKSKRCLTPSELMKLAEHPVLTLDALASLGVGISRVARIVAYQIHERCDGSGYPRGRTNDEIHGLAKIAAVADAYIGLVSNRAHRRGMLPYFAIQKILKSIPLGHFDPKAVRALLHAMSLFPVGSFVETSIGRIGRVVRSNGKAYLSPTIELWNEKHKQFDPDLVNLAEENSLRIVKASPVPKAA